MPLQRIIDVVQLVPELDPARVKLGFTGDTQSRLRVRTVAPTARLVKIWPCRAAWEKTAITSVTRIGCERIGEEVYKCQDLDALLKRADAFFALMPDVRTSDRTVGHGEVVP